MARYLKRRKRGWYFQLEIPAHLREHFGGRARVEQTLSTRDERLAEAKAKQLAGEYKLRFLALEGVPQAKQALTRSTYHDSVKAVLENEILAFGRPEDDPVDLGVELAVDKILDKPGRRYDEDGDPILSVADKGVTFRCLQQGAIDTSRSDGKLLLNILASFAEFEADIRSERQRDGIEKAKARGIYKGRPKCIDPTEVRRLKESGLGATEIAEKLGIGRASVYRALAS